MAKKTANQNTNTATIDPEEAEAAVEVEAAVEAEETTQNVGKNGRVLLYEYPPEYNTPELRQAYRRVQRKAKRKEARLQELREHPQRASTPAEKKFVAENVPTCGRCGDKADNTMISVIPAGAEQPILIHGASCILETDTRQ